MNTFKIVIRTSPDTVANIDIPLNSFVDAIGVAGLVLNVLETATKERYKPFIVAIRDEGKTKSE